MVNSINSWVWCLEYSRRVINESSCGCSWYLRKMTSSDQSPGWVSWENSLFRQLPVLLGSVNMLCFYMYWPRISKKGGGQGRGGGCCTVGPEQNVWVFCYEGIKEIDVESGLGVISPLPPQWLFFFLVLILFMIPTTSYILPFFWVVSLTTFILLNISLILGKFETV